MQERFFFEDEMVDFTNILLPSITLSTANQPGNFWLHVYTKCHEILSNNGEENVL
jgi:hypothetical protein